MPTVREASSWERQFEAIDGLGEELGEGASAHGLGAGEPEHGRERRVGLEDLTLRGRDHDADGQPLDQASVGRVLGRGQGAPPGAEEGGANRGRQLDETLARFGDIAVDVEPESVVPELGSRPRR